jgi:hypothetical protein
MSSGSSPPPATATSSGQPVAPITTIITIMTTAMAMPATVAHAIDVVAVAIIITTIIIIQPVVLSKER